MKLLFDCDGTILDSMHIWVEPMNQIFEKYGFSFKNLEKEEKGEIEALSLSDMVKYISENIATDMSEEEVHSYFNEIIEDAYKNHLMPKAGALEALTKLHKEGYEMAIASSTDSSYLKMAFERLNIDHYFSFYTTPDTTNSKKSDSDYWKYAIDKFKVSPDQIILYDDALYAIKAANNKSIKTCGVEDFPYNEKEWEDIKKSATFTLKSIADIDPDNLLI